MFVKDVTSQDGVIFSEGVIPENLDLFKDHFPEFPVVPGVLLLEIMRESVERYKHAPVRIKRISSLRFSHFLKPGVPWRARVEFSFEHDQISECRGTVRQRDNNITVASAQFVLDYSE